MRRSEEIVYEVPTKRLTEKTLYFFSFSRSGYAFLGRCGVEDFEEGYPRKYKYFEPLEKLIDEIQDLRFRVKSPVLDSLISEINEVFVPMVDEIKDYEKRLNFKCRFMGHQARLADAFRDPKLYYFTIMSLPDDGKRIKSLRVTKKWIYQLWVLKLVCEALGTSRFSYHRDSGEAYWWIEQGSEFSTCVGETPYGSVSFWVEFQSSRVTHVPAYVQSMLASKHVSTGKQVPARPDIVVVRGYYERTSDFVKSGKDIDVLVECKENPFDLWKNDIDSQILPYLRVFKPRIFVLASLQSVPDHVRNFLNREGIIVVDELKPHSSSIRLLHEILSSQLS
ncbi:MAG: hypothetical protein QXU60_03030 [Sulfolobales archaeon]